MQKIEKLIENSATPKVSIIVLAYNHEYCIERCLQSILMQQTQYQVELIIHDDASTDKTREIIDKIIKTKSKNINKIYSKQNKFSLGIRLTAELFQNNVRGEFFVMEMIIGEIIFVKKMVKELISDKNSSFCFSDVQKFYNGQDKNYSPHLPERNKRDFSTHDLKILNYAYIHLGASFFRNLSVKFPDEFFLQRNGDTWFPMLWGEFGYGKYVQNCGFLAYRINEKGMWGSQNEQQKEITRLVFACQMTSYLLKKGHLDAAINQAPRFNPIMLAYQRSTKSA